MPHTVPNKPTKGAVEPTVAEEREALAGGCPMRSIARATPCDPGTEIELLVAMCVVLSASELFSATKPETRCPR